MIEIALTILAVKFIPRGWVITPIAALMAAFTVLSVMGRTEAMYHCLVITTAVYLYANLNSSGQSLARKSLRAIWTGLTAAAAAIATQAAFVFGKPTEQPTPAFDNDTTRAFDLDATIELPVMTDEVLDAYEAEQWANLHAAYPHVTAADVLDADQMY